MSALHYMERGGSAIVPDLWLYELVSVLAKAEKVETLSAEKAALFLEQIQIFNITIEPATTERVLQAVSPLSTA